MSKNYGKQTEDTNVENVEVNADMTAETTVDATAPIDFSDPDSIANELAAAAAPAATTKEANAKKPKVIKVTYTATEDSAAGTTITFDYEMPVGTGTRGMVSGIALVDMTDDELKIEHRNANSVFYKQQKAAKDTTKSGERLEKVKAEMAKRGITPSSRGTANVDANTVAALIKAGKIDLEDLNKLLGGVEETPADATPAE